MHRRNLSQNGAEKPCRCIHLTTNGSEKFGKEYHVPEMLNSLTHSIQNIRFIFWIGYRSYCLNFPGFSQSFQGSIFKESTTANL